MRASVLFALFAVLALVALGAHVPTCDCALHYSEPLAFGQSTRTNDFVDTAGYTSRRLVSHQGIPNILPNSWEINMNADRVANCVNPTTFVWDYVAREWFDLEGLTGSQFITFTERITGQNTVERPMKPHTRLARVPMTRTAFAKLSALAIAGGETHNYYMITCDDVTRFDNRFQETNVQEGPQCMCLKIPIHEPDIECDTCHMFFGTASCSEDPNGPQVHQEVWLDNTLDSSASAHPMLDLKELVSIFNTDTEEEDPLFSCSDASSMVWVPTDPNGNYTMGSWETPVDAGLEGDYALLTGVSDGVELKRRTVSDDELNTLRLLADDQRYVHMRAICGTATADSGFTATDACMCFKFKVDGETFGPFVKCSERE